MARTLISRLVALGLAVASSIALSGEPTVSIGPARISGASGTTLITPKYPARQLRLGIGGTTIVSLNYGPDGRVSSAKILRSSGDRGLDKAALAAAKMWRFEPLLLRGERIHGYDEASVTFKP